MGRAIALVLLVDLVAGADLDPLPVEALRLRIFDLYQLIAPREATARPVAIVDIDEDSLKASANGRGRAPSSPTSSRG